MKIPNKIDKLLERRQKLAEELSTVSAELDDWLMSKGADLTHPDLVDCTLTGCLIYCEPSNANRCVREFIENEL